LFSQPRKIGGEDGGSEFDHGTISTSMVAVFHFLHIELGLYAASFE
jgi:hypothetical protein